MTDKVRHTESAARQLLYLYAGMGLLTLIFQIWVRSSQCAGIQECALSYAKAIVWAAIWPASWIVYLAGFL